MPLHTSLFNAARWLRDAPREASWRGKVFSQLANLLKTDGIPGPFFVAKKSLPKSIRQRLAQEMISWQNTDAGRNLLNTLRIGPFEKFNPAEYEALMKKLQEFQ